MSFLITYSLVRGLLEDPFRDVPLFWKLTDPTTQGIGILTMSQLISVPIILIGVWGLMQLRRWQPAEGTAAASTQSGLTRQQRRARDRSGKT
jgi:prolipoprotein diacylglyceryltransferase